ncbi:HEAT repeat domain-containing protein [Rhodocyclus tenuis]|uniref:HEAT repeat domain-containing protein n=1 Tax=Rhodocyclus tenuis TaxID=1066 RepID=UPI001903EE0A|nr:HEAT repeat domain-containing protein [Rhodocyclus tenuis]MBK1679770.1 PBS lyase [Rhodocyclus tenuis]
MAFIKKSPGSETLAHEERRFARDCAGLALELESADASERRWAARDLADCPDASALLLSRLQREDDASVRELILSTLTRLGDEAAVLGLVNCLRSENAALRNEAIECMKQLPDEVAPIMQCLLADADADVRIFAVNVLESLCHPEVESWLIQVIESDAQVNVCATAVDLLGEVGSAAAREALLRLKARFADEPYMQFATDLALKRLAAN